MVNKSPRFSVLLPTHNRADVIHCAIESVLFQTESDFELLIVGDGCTDRTAQVVGRYLKDKRVKWFDFAKGPGFGYNHRNTVFKQARGKYIAFIAHDDIPFNDHLEKLGTHLDKNPAIDIVYSRALWVDRKGNIMPSTFNLNNKKMLRHFMDIGNAIPASCFVHRRSCFKRLGYWNDKLPQAADWDMYKRIIAAGQERNFIFEPRPTSLHFLASWRSTHTHDEWPHVQATGFAKKQKFLAELLKISVSKDEPEQITFWRQIKKNPARWAVDIRRSVEALIDSTQYYSTLELPKLQVELSTTGQQKINLEKQVSNQKTQIKIREKQIEELKTDNSRLHKELGQLDRRLHEIQSSITFALHRKFFARVKPNSRLHRAIRTVIRRLT